MSRKWVGRNGGIIVAQEEDKSLDEMIALLDMRDSELANAGVLPIDTSLRDALSQKFDWFVTDVKNNGIRAGLRNIKNNVLLLSRYLTGASQSKKDSLDNPYTWQSEIEAFKESISSELNRPVRVLDLNYYMFCPPTSGGMMRILSPLLKMHPEDGVMFSMVFTTYSEEYADDCERYLNTVPVIEFSKGVVAYKYKSPRGKKPEDIPKDVWACISRELVGYLKVLLAQIHYDIIQVEHSQLAWIVPFLRKYSPNSKIVLDAHNVEYRVYETWLPYCDVEEKKDIEQNYNQLKKWEERIWPWFDYAFSVSPEEQRIIKENGIPNVYLVPTGGGIDPEKYAPKSIQEHKLDILYIGSMNWYANTHGLIWFINEVLPIIEERRPGTNINIVGSGMPSDYLLSCIDSHPDIKFWGFQENDDEFFHNAKVFIVPLWIGAGARVKVITAWAAKIPVVSTVFGAEGSFTENGKNILLCDEPMEFAEAVLGLLDNPDYRERIADNAFHTLLDRYTTSRCVEILDSAYKEMSGTNQPNTI